MPCHGISRLHPISRLWVVMLLFLIVSLVAYLAKSSIMNFNTKPNSTLLAVHHRRTCQSTSVPTQLAALPGTPIITQALEVADKIANEARAHNEVAQAILFLSNSKYELRFEEMIATWSQFVDRSSLVMAALDDTTAAYFKERGINTVRVLPEELDCGEHSIREAVLQTKVVIPYVFLLKKLRVVMVEMDIYCRSNPLIFDHGTADILISEHDYCEEVNVGFWIAYSTCPVIDSFRRMYEWITNENRADAYCDGAFDQKLMHFAWLGNGALSAGSSSRCRDFGQRDQVFDLRKHEPVALERISVQDIMHWPAQQVDPENWPGKSSNPSCVHIWSAFGSAQRQIQYGYGHDWFPAESKGEARDALEQLGLLKRTE